VPESKVLLLSKIEDREVRASYLADVEGLSRDAIAKVVKERANKDRGGAESQVEVSPEDSRLVDEMQRALGLKVRMQRSSSDEEKGKVTIEFYSSHDLQELFRKIVS
jgi:hypothetical protein